MPTEFQLFQDARGEWRWRLRAENNKNIAAASEGYRARSDAMRSVDILRHWEGSAATYKDAKGEWRWRLVATNGNIIATSGEGYVARSDCDHGMELAQKLAVDARVNEA